MRGSTPGERRGGRQKGTPNKKTQELQTEIRATGETPLEYMLRVMRDQTLDHPRRDDMAAKAAPYVHARLAATEVTGKDGQPIEMNFSNRDAARAVLALLREAEIEEAK